ncbi:UPF0236 family transposase-like protein, partial [Oceanobacillus caeni]
SELLKDTNDLIDFEEHVQIYVYDLLTKLMGSVFTQLNQTIKRRMQSKGWTVEREDEKTIHFIFGAVRFTHTLMHDINGKAHYPFDEWVGFRKYQRHSPLVEVKVAELASESTYRETARILSEWTAVNLSHTTVGSMVKRVGKAQAQADEELLAELEEAAYLPKGKELEFLFAEADG